MASQSIFLKLTVNQLFIVNYLSVIMTRSLSALQEKINKLKCVISSWNVHDGP